jgi:hypothetical protein
MYTANCESEQYLIAVLDCFVGGFWFESINLLETWYEYVSTVVTVISNITE